MDALLRHNGNIGASVSCLQQRMFVLDTFGAETRVDQVSRHRNKNSLKLNYTSYMGFLYGVVYSL